MLPGSREICRDTTLYNSHLWLASSFLKSLAFSTCPFCCNQNYYPSWLNGYISKPKSGHHLQNWGTAVECRHKKDIQDQNLVRVFRCKFVQPFKLLPFFSLAVAVSSPPRAVLLDIIEQQTWLSKAVGARLRV